MMKEKIEYGPWKSGWHCTVCDRLHHIMQGHCTCGLDYLDSRAKRMSIRLKIVTRTVERPFLVFFKKKEVETLSRKWISHTQYHREVDEQEAQQCPSYDPLSRIKKSKKGE